MTSPSLMDPLIILLATLAVLIICIEITLWTLFRRRLVRICLPPQADVRLVRFFTLPRLRICIVIHTVMLCLIFYLFYFLLW